MLRLDGFLPYRLNVLAKRISQALARLYEDRFGISIPEWRVLATLGERQPLSSNDIVERTRMDKAKVSRAVSRLAEAGLLDRQPHPEDQRLLRLSFTPEGRALYDRLAPQALEWERRLLEDFSAEDVRALDGLIDRLNDRLDRMR
ncbi:MAG TPA: MarR family transcriptional regulator [Azospirillaceae bacterium]|nr:MarR family transcriptional regulator [Azospirillaceae bacterium]